VIANNEPHLEDQGDDDEYYYHYSSNDNDAPAVIQLSNFQYAEVSMSQNQFDNPDAVRELSVNVRLPPTFVVDLGLNFWDRSNYSAVIQRYVCQTLAVIIAFNLIVLCCQCVIAIAKPPVHHTAVLYIFIHHCVETLKHRIIMCVKVIGTCGKINAI